MYTIIISIIALVVGAYYFFYESKTSKMDDYFVSTKSQSDDRVKALNLDKPSEDMSYILDTNQLGFEKKKRKKDAEIEYKADAEREWILSLNSMGGKLFMKEDIDKIFDLEWRKNYNSTIYGLSPEDNKWTYANAGGAPNSFTKLQIAVSLMAPFNEATGAFDKKIFEKYTPELAKRLKKQGFSTEITPSESLESAIIKGKKLVEFKNEFNHEAIIVLKGDKAFDGKTAWDALICTGLKWGDGDIFHWENYGSDVGHDTHFSVWTTTNPGYFFPEQVINGQMNPQDLIFGFSIPRCADPENVFKAMLNTVKYCQKRLGGFILDKNGQPFNEQNEQMHLLLILEKMKNKGLIPGSEKALRTF
jgi:FtsZ-interacting cell division protein ZipA